LSDYPIASQTSSSPGLQGEAIARQPVDDRYANQQGRMTSDVIFVGIAMFHVPTVFILGAGASWHYGYPTGEELVKMVVERAKAAERYFSSLFNTMTGLMDDFPLYIREQRPSNVSEARHLLQVAANDAKELASRLRQVNPLVIDYFLGQNPSLQRMGTLLIAWIILECEAAYHKVGANINRRKLQANSPNPTTRFIYSDDELKLFKDDWYRFIIHKLVMGYTKPPELLSNEVTFITFNYDVSLERSLYNGLRSIEFLNPPDREWVDMFLGSNRIIPVPELIESRDLR
jgi:hypothetical protein